MNSLRSAADRRMLIGEQENRSPIRPHRKFCIFEVGPLSGSGSERWRGPEDFELGAQMESQKNKLESSFHGDSM